MSAVLEAQEPSSRYLEAAQPTLVRQFDLLTTTPAGVRRLRALIQTLAVQGKLVAQHPGDEPASVLLTRLRTQKARMVSAGDIRAAKPFAEVSEEEQPFSLPATWTWARFGDVTINRDGERIPVSSDDRERRAKVYDYYGASGVIDKIDGYLFDKTLLLIGEDGANLLNRSTPIAFLAHGKYWVNNHAHVIDTIEPGLMRYLELFINAISLEPYVTGTAQPKMNQAKLNNIVVALPPLAEQARIVTRVDELMRLCDALEAKGRLEAEQHVRLLGTLLGTLTDSRTPEELAANWQRVADHFDLLLDRPEAVDALEQTILQLAVRGLLVPKLSSDQSASSLLEQIRESGEQKKSQGTKSEAVSSEVQPDEMPFEVPDSWAWSRFGQIAEIASDLVQPAGHGSEWQVAPDCIEKGTGRLLAKRTVADADVKSANHRFHPGQIIYSKIRPSLSKAVIVDFAGLCSADMYPINAKISPQYLLLVILSRCFLDQVAAAENRVKMPKLNQESLTAFLVPVPPLAEQARIVARVTELRRLCADLRQRLTASQTTQSHLAEVLVAELA
ncbi:MAG: restriction endonuclease subunit S [Rubrivivax sp.]|nr:restriction endonuclease subunit S [Rubrivivax sp.]